MADVLDEGALANLLAMVGDDPDLLDDLVDKYLADAPNQLAAMRLALAADSAADLVRLARTLRDTSLNMGALELAEAGRSLEELARRGDLDGAPIFLEEAEVAFARVREALAGERMLDPQGE